MGGLGIQHGLRYKVRMSKQSYISIFVKDMRVSVRIGLLEAEKAAPQALDVSVELLVAADYLKGADEASLIDYARLHDFIKGWETRAHTALLETLMTDLIDFAFQMDGRIQGVRVSLCKPDIFAAAEAGLSAEIWRESWSQ